MNRGEHGVERRKGTMSLRRKIVLLFLGLAVVPMLTVATFGFFYAEWLAEDVTSSGLAEVTNRAARHFADAAERSRPSFAAPLANSVASNQLTRCDEGGASRVLPIRATAGPGVAESRVWAGDLLPPDLVASTGQQIRVIDRSDGSVVYSFRCADLSGGSSRALTAMEEVLADDPAAWSKFRFTDESGKAHVASASVTPDGRWAVVATANMQGILAPLSKMEASYWFFVLMLATGTALAFSLMLGHVTRSLNDLTRAAERIGRGDLQPWLPPPGRDEVGRLTLAFSDMLQHVRRMMDHVDHNGRLAVVGQLSSYLAHEIRNPLSSIKMNLQRLQRNVGSGRMPRDCSDAVEISLKEVDRLATSVTSILQLGCSDQAPPDVVSLENVILEATELLQGELKKAGVEVSVDLDSAADRVVAVQGQMKGVFLNLMMNALEAQQLGGRLEFRSELETSSGGAPVVAVKIRDYGHGVPAAVRDRIFEPFFTTKPTGSGIGLAVVARTLRDNGGDIRLEDLPVSEQGTEFVITLPLAAVGESEPTQTASRWRRPDGAWARPVVQTPPETTGEPEEEAPVPAEPILSVETTQALNEWVADKGRFH